MLHCKSNDIPDMKFACAFCGCVDFPPVMTHDAIDVQIAVTPNITSSNSKKESHMSEMWAAVHWHSHGVGALSRDLLAILVFALPLFLDL